MMDLKILNDFKLKVQIQIAWADMDALGHVNSSKYFVYFETARIQYYEHLDLRKQFSVKNIAGVVARTECSYFVPLTYPDTITAGARVTSLSEDFLTMEYFIKSDIHGLVAIGEAEIVFYSFKIKSKIDIPANILSKIRKFENLK
jgi:acyl-CoA thioester hydrolase